MSRQRLKILAAGAILVAGFSVALLFFRQVRQSPVTDTAASTENVPLRQSFNPSVEDEGATPHLAGRIEPIIAPAAPPSATVSQAPAVDPAATTPLAAHPPQVADRYQSFLPGPTDPFESAVERKGPSRSSGSQPRYRRHVIRDGDTLAGLAERYLGDPSRQSEILSLNREALRASDVLPIGTVLRIPPAAASSSTAAPTSTSSPLAVPTIAPSPAEEPLVPVPAAEPAAAPVVSASTPVEPPIAVPAPAEEGWRPAPAP